MKSRKKFDQFIGQQRVIGHLRRLIEGAKTLGQPCPSLLFTGPSGYGKTALAEAVAAEYGSGFHRIFAGKDTRAAHVASALAGLNHADVLLVDEAQSLTEDAQQILFLALDHKKAPPVLLGKLDRSTEESIADFTLIAATDQPGRVKRALRRRLRPIEFDPYSQADLANVARLAAGQAGMKLTADAAARIAEVAQGVPDRARQRVADLRVCFPGVRRWGVEHVEEVLAQEGLDAQGLTPHQRRYLSTLAGSPRNTCPLARLSASLGCDVANLREEIEPGLLRLGLIDVRAGAGRTLTDAGRDWAAAQADASGSRKGGER